MKGVSIRNFRQSDIPSIKRIIKSLHPDWFDKEEIKNIPRDIQFEKCFVAEKNKKVVGFVGFHSYMGNPRIGEIGVDKTLRHDGIGTLLMEKVEEELKKYNFDLVRLDTVGECTPRYQPYVETRKFYRKMGFELEKKGHLRKSIEKGKTWRWRLSTFKKKLNA